MERDDGIDLFREESPRVEWKESHQAKDLLDAVCAFANDLDGRGLESFVVIGVDKRGRPTGAYHHDTQADEVQQHLANLLSSTKILPHPDVQIEPIEREGALVFVLRVRPYAVPPVVKVAGTPWIRAGTVTRRANDGELRRLEERRPPHQQPFDTRPCPGATFDDVDLGLLQAKHRADREVDGDPDTFLDFERWLRQRGLLVLVDGAWTLNNAAILTYGLSPQDFLPGAFIDITVYQGDDFDSPILARKTATGSLPAQLQTAWNFLESLNAETATEGEGLAVTFEPIYPAAVVKELVRNLAQHRDYAAVRAPSRIAWLSDRLVFTNPGAPYGQAALGELGEHSDYRNPQLTALLLELGYVERAGRGVRRARKVLTSHGFPPLGVETNGFTTITVRRRA